ncbi:hypothetical protein Q0M94_25020 (plasmid) [Deinococcus radiomollis]|uniref:hypothetical protein n=1 Tax=Deinococcus radiomollis TaxID=468916 RepID=UPI003891D488
MSLEFGNISIGSKPYSSVSKLIRTWQTTHCGWKDPRPEGELSLWDVNFAALLPSQSAKDAAIKLTQTGVVGCLTVIGKAGAACDAWVLTEKVDNSIVVVASGSHSANGHRWLSEILNKDDQRGLSSSVRPTTQARKTPSGTKQRVQRSARVTSQIEQTQSA